VALALHGIVVVVQARNKVWWPQVIEDTCSKRQTLLFFSFVGCGMKLSPLGTSATIWPIVLAPDDRWWWLWSNRWDENWERKPKYSEKTCPSITWSTTNPTWLDLGSSPGRRCEKMVTNRLSSGPA
jgi:hypothetical protein